jgi:serine/threonine protein kinase
VTKGITLGLVYLHKRNVVHRDIKPGNILLDDAGEIKLGERSRVVGPEQCAADFGISRQVGAGQQAQTMVGTPQFLAPEIVTSRLA